MTAAPNETAESEQDAAEQEPEPVLVPHRPAGKRLKVAAAAAAVLFVAGAAFAGAMAQPVIANRALVQTKLDIAHTAELSSPYSRQALRARSWRKPRALPRWTFLRLTARPT